MIVMALFLLAAEPADPWVAKRHLMVRETIAEPPDGRPAVRDEAVLAAMRKVERHRFVPESRRDSAYDDKPLPIGFEQTISQPYIVAVMTELVAPEPGHVVLEVGTGSGYQAAVLAEIVGHVYTIEIVEELAARATRDLAAAGYDNVTVKAGDGYVGWPEHAPFDSIVVTAAPDHVPQPLVDQLKTGGRLVLPVGPNTWAGQELVVMKKRADGTLERTRVMAVRFVPLTGEHVQGKKPK
jgi:protein-L-isoaspartate(D-aspartate) O-methyltransferase